MFATLVLLSSLVASGIAKPYLTSPVEGTVCNGGETCSITWQEDSTEPSLEEFGEASVGLYVGNPIQQTLLQVITDSVNVATTQAIDFTVDPNIGPDDDVYFIRFDSLNSRNGSAPNQAFSAHFTLANMSGSFNSSVQDQINAVDGTPVATAESTPAATTSGLTRVPTSASTGSTASRSSAASTALESAVADEASSAGRVGFASGVGFLGTVVALFALAF